MARIAAELQDTTRQIEVALRQVELANQLGDHAEAQRIAQSALTVAHQQQNPRLEAASLSALGAACSALGDYDRAHACHAEALELCRAFNDLPGQAVNLWYLGDIARLRGQAEAALNYLENSLKLYRALEDRAGESDALNGLANAIMDAARKRDYYEQSLALAQTLGDRRRQARSYNNLALTYWKLGLYDRARDYIEQAVQLEREIQGRSALAYDLESLGRIYLELEEYSQALQVYEEGRALAQDIGDPNTESIYWYGIGRIMLARGKPEAAQKLIQTAVNIQQELALNSFLSTSLAWLSAAHLALGDWESADRASAAAVACLTDFASVEFLPQEVWWHRYLVLKSVPDAEDAPLSDAAWEALQNAHSIMLEMIASLSDEGLRRNYLNKVKVNREIIAAWTRYRAGRIEEPAEAQAVEAERLSEAERVKDQLKRVLGISRRMNETHDLASLLNYVMDQVIELTGAERGFLVLFDKAGQMDFRVARGMAQEELEWAKAQVSYTVLGAVIQSRQPVLLQDALTDMRFGAQSSVLELNLRSVLCVPLISSAELIGMIYTDNRSVSGRFAQTDVDLMMIFANQAAIAIENADLYENLTSVNRELEAWAQTLEERVNDRTAALRKANTALSHRAVQLETSSEVAQQITSILDVDVLLAEVVALINKRFNYYFVGVWMLNPRRDALRLRAHATAQHHTFKQPVYEIPRDRSTIITTAFRNGKPRLVKRVEAEPDYLQTEELPNVASELALPLAVGNYVLGVLDIASDREGDFSEEDRMVLQTLGDQIAVAVRNAQSYELEQHRRQLAELLEQTGRALASELDLLAIPSRILELLDILTPYERGVLFLRRGDGFEPAAQRGYAETHTLSALHDAIPREVLAQILKQRRALLVENVALDARWQSLSAETPAHYAWLGVPVISKDAIFGILALTRSVSGAFTLEDATWAQAFAAQAGIALENAHLYAEIKAFNEQLEQRVQERTAELDQAYRILARLDKNKSDFINVAAHELRTPLTVIMGYAQVLHRQCLSAENAQNRMLEGIMQGADRLHEIVNSMLDVAKIDNQTLKMYRSDVYLEDVIQRVRMSLLSALQERNQHLLLDGLAALPPIHADHNLLYKVFYQLLVNAIKYTPDGGKIEIVGRLESAAGGAQSILICVKDTGIGIDPAEQALIFEKFYQIGETDFHSSGRTKFKGGGPGLGLAIARGIIQAHGGKIWVESAGCDERTCPGSCFYVQFPVNQKQQVE